MTAKKEVLNSTMLGGAGVLLVGVALSLVHPWGNLRLDSSRDAPILQGASAPNEIRELLARKCNDCHSNRTRWPLYSNFAPTSWLVEHDVHAGREHLNLSRWEEYGIDSRIDLLSKMGSQIRDGKMPLKQYVLLHPEARLSDSERKLIQNWIKVERKRLLTQEEK
ncbi:MAG TPA: heme-binding domain-containing protein [Candidatus Saccharimonadales bacterium]|nr:heme-binding domain-containing protein [Candidatus Saccharimonadales bacterium]